MNPSITPLHHADLRLAVVNHLRWCPGTLTVTDDEVSMEGWALSLWERQDQLRFMINGVDFESVEWLASPDLVPFFDGVPNASASRFRCRRLRPTGTWPFDDGYARFNVTTQPAGRAGPAQYSRAGAGLPVPGP